MLVLVVEDNVCVVHAKRHAANTAQLINQKLLKRQLQKAGYQVGTANNGLEGL